MSNISKTMILIESTWNDGKTFRLIPVSNECPYIECIYDPASKVMVIISKTTKTSLHMLPKLDNNGDPIYLKMGKRPNGKSVIEERKSIETFQEYYIEDEDSISVIVNMIAVNSDSFNIKKYMIEDKPVMPK